MDDKVVERYKELEELGEDLTDNLIDNVIEQVKLNKVREIDKLRGLSIKVSFFIAKPKADDEDEEKVPELTCETYYPIADLT